MKLIRPMVIFSLIMVSAPGVSFLVHRWILEGDSGESLPLLPGFYLMNLVMGILIGVVIIYLSEVRPEITGFSFMGGSLLKFAVFFMLFFPLLSEDEAARKGQFLAFFIPYAITMVIEVWFLIRYLNKQSE